MMTLAARELFAKRGDNRIFFAQNDRRHGTTVGLHPATRRPSRTSSMPKGKDYYRSRLTLVQLGLWFVDKLET